MTWLAPAAPLPGAQGNAPVQSPALDTNVRPAGVTSATETPAASLGPLLVTVIVYTTLVPGATVPGAQGKAPLQAPLFELNVSPAGIASATDAAAASLGPLLVTVIVYT